MSPDLKADLAQLADHPFTAPRNATAVMRAIHEALGLPSVADQHPGLDKLRRWLLAPYSLWPIDIKALATELTSELCKRVAPSPLVLATVDTLTSPPHAKVVEAVFEFERKVIAGDYGPQTKAAPKLDERADEVARSAALAEEWDRLKPTLTLPPSSKGVLRRSQVQERNFRGHFNKEVLNDRQRSQMAFDAFCHKWDLYGMEGDKPLVLKLTGTVTPFGTLVMIPGYLSFDPRRDAAWTEILRIHKLQAKYLRQGEKLSTGRTERRQQAEAARRAHATGRANGLKGRRLHEFTCLHANLPIATEPRTLRRLLGQSPMRPGGLRETEHSLHSADTGTPRLQAHKP